MLDIFLEFKINQKCSGIRHCAVFNMVILGEYIFLSIGEFQHGLKGSGGPQPFSPKSRTALPGLLGTTKTASLLVYIYYIIFMFLSILVSFLLFSSGQIIKVISETK